ncbi:MAG TPA: hypothetical protein VFE46_02010 [Pirellulales bacterium]|jgi:hypothetical protein|nr:hypothetical protein [Pirellulales bacterium]
MNLTALDRQILWTLTRKVRVLTAQQVAETWFADLSQPTRAAVKRLRQLQDFGLLNEHAVMLHPMIHLDAPVLNWMPGNEEPNFGALSYRLKERWPSPLVTKSIFHATRDANRLLGGYIGGRQPRTSETTHDVHLAQVYLRFLRQEPRTAKRWVSEHQLYAEGGGRNERLPDAIIRHPRNRDLDLVVEFGGKYPKMKLIEFHDALRHLRYQIW